MSEKVILPKDLTNAIENLLKRGSGAEDILINVAQAVISDDDLKVLTKFVYDGTGFNGRFLKLTKALVNGYETEREQTPEEMVRNFYTETVRKSNNHPSDSAERIYYNGLIRGTEYTLKFLKVEIEGVNA